MKLRLAVLTFAAVLLAGSVHASGSVSQPNVPQRKSNGGADSLTRGKDAYMNKLACEACPVAGGVETAPEAQALIGRIDKGEFKLKRAEKKHIKAYLRSRFEIN
jgi:hypothetical protein